ncbi:uncharacterized protein BO95DRAFT_240231 [Aspergillus brunneoviolaceus CBS 621.78]|uniref:Uncharacterized protein n=1 Tax=Aspergillus brunneoviolaceus CBS 621.78 TaxID=1450534 RepID=A0ACD1FZ98_9EURO|nr:hypothetical protein BO95DRAFT_240231 [Aspergillus brunneoviolaceus CBS 621.78]RAH42272.1 hypothetical protein BO95DRAFT_240231 [Aspergillus brunneoviolaceus CBS 621.78]
MSPTLSAPQPITTAGKRVHQPGSRGGVNKRQLKAEGCLFLFSFFSPPQVASFCISHLRDHWSSFTSRNKSCKNGPQLLPLLRCYHRWRSEDLRLLRKGMAYISSGLLFNLLFMPLDLPCLKSSSWLRGVVFKSPRDRRSQSQYQVSGEWSMVWT